MGVLPGTQESLDQSTRGKGAGAGQDLDQDSRTSGMESVCGRGPCGSETSSLSSLSGPLRF